MESTGATIANESAGSDMLSVITGRDVTPECTGMASAFFGDIESLIIATGGVPRRVGRTGLFGVSEKMLTGLTNAHSTTPASTVNKRYVYDDTFPEVKYILFYRIDNQPHAAANRHNFY